jgi:16S rRNA (cytidine1402-2'-O)-methyltransferase
MPLSVCATPIGNLDDVTLRVLAELRTADLVLCEDTRRTRKLLDRHGVVAQLVSYHRHNEATRTAEVLPRLQSGDRIALVSDAGLPGINDPGARLLAAAIAADVPVTVLPGPSAVETALVISGLAIVTYRFVGYFPRGTHALPSLWEEIRVSPDAIVGFESPRRLPVTLASLARALPERRVAVCRELTKRFEEVARGSAADVALRFDEPPKGEVTIVIEASASAAVSGAAVDAASEGVAELMGDGLGRRRAVDVVSRLTGVPKNLLYRRSL